MAYRENALLERCRGYSAFFHDGKQNTINLLSLSRIILDTIAEQVSLRQIINIDRLTDAAVLMNSEKRNIPELEQYLEYQQFLGGFGDSSYDRYNMLLKFAPNNCYAAHELASVYFFGKTHFLSSKNTFEVEQSYNNAAEWYLKSIEKSTPPLKGSCWSLGYTLLNMRYDTEAESMTAEKKAMEYMKLAGDYPPAQNHLA